MLRKPILLLALLFLVPLLYADLVPYLSLGPTLSFVDHEKTTWVSPGLMAEGSVLSFDTHSFLWSFPGTFQYVFPSQTIRGLRLPRHFSVTLGAKVGRDLGLVSFSCGLSGGYEGYGEEMGGLVFLRGALEAAATYPKENLALVLRLWGDLKETAPAYGGELLLRYRWRFS